MLISCGRGCHRVGALVWRHYRQTLTWIGPNLIKLIRPAGYLLLSVGLGSAVGPVVYRGHTLSYIDFLLPGILAMLAFEEFGDALARSANEKQWGVYRAAVLKGTGPGEYLAGQIGFSLIWFCFRALAIVGVAFLFGARPAVAVIPAWLVFSVLGVILWVCVGVTAGIRIDTYNLRDTLLSVLMLPLTFASAVFYDPSGAPALLRAVASVNPLSLFATGMRDVSAGAAGLPLLSLGVLALLAALAFVGARQAIRRAPLIVQDR